MNLFLYGTLLDKQVLARVVGMPIVTSRLKAAALQGYRRVAIHGTPFPMLVPHPRGIVVGRVLLNPDRALVARLIRYEGRSYDLRWHRVALTEGCVIDAGVFMARRGVRPSLSDWTVEDWRRNRRRRFRHETKG